jgi:methylenetetrahydrofolate dehydrogenase (NADP+)/methenyltetrahydrofolate cyclohydrolase
MTAIILDGQKLSVALQQELAAHVAEFVARGGPSPTLAAVLVGEDPASEVYVRNKRLACEKVGMQSRLHRLPAGTSQAELLALLEQLNTDPGTHGILVQLPLPKHLETASILHAVSPLKDVDAFHPENVGRVVQGEPRFLPCTPHGIVQILRRHDIPTAGKNVVVVGRSDIVGKPIAIMLMQKGADATVTVCHSRTKDLAAVTRSAEILIVAIGQPKFITVDMVKPGAVVIDVGIHRTESGLCGDVDFAEVAKVASAITPVPRGVGPLTVTMLLFNTLAAAKLQTVIA